MALELAIPAVRQTTDYTCGPASLCSILRYYGHRVSERVAMRKAGTTREGTYLSGMVQGARAYGIEPWTWENITYKMLQDTNEVGYPVVALVQAWHACPEEEHPCPFECGYANGWDDGHYVVVTNVDAHEVVMMDPSQPGARSVLSADEWLERWHDVDIGRKMNHTVIVFPTGSIRRRRIGRVKRMG